MKSDPDNYWEVLEIRTRLKSTCPKSDLQKYFLRLLKLLEKKLKIPRTNQRELIIDADEVSELEEDEIPLRSEVIEIGNLDETKLSTEELIKYCKRLGKIHNDFL